MTTISTVAAIVFLLCIPAAYYFGRRSSVDHAINRALDKETRLPHINDQHRADRAEEGRDG